jgi:KaiC/GvpD/RAD55 family RecA-like ATPase
MTALHLVAEQDGMALAAEPSGASLRVPPHSLEAEQSVLGALLQDPGCWPLVSDLVTEASFYVHAHRLVFTAVAELLAERQPVDVVTVFERLQARQQDEHAGGLKHLMALSMSVPSSRNARRYAEIVAERALDRTLIAALDEASTIAWKGEGELDDRLDRLAEVVRRVDQQRKGPVAHRVPLLALDALRESAEAVSWLCKRVIPADSVGMLFGGSGTFKTYLALDLALHVCHGLPWMGRKTRKGPAIYVAAEGGAGLWARIQAWHQARGLDWRTADLRVVPVALDLGADAWRVVDAAQAAGVTPALVVVDTLSQTYAGEENSANEMAAYLRALGTRFRALWRCAVMVVHHSGHSATERPRGSSAIRANLDFLLGAFRDEAEMLVTLTCVKQKDGELFDDAIFSLRVQDLGEDDDGDRITQLAARHLSTGEEVERAMSRERGAGRGGKNQMLLSLLQNGMRVEELRKAFFEDCIELATAEAKRQAFHRAKGWAINAGFMEIAEGVVIIKKGAV